MFELQQTANNNNRLTFKQADMSTWTVVTHPSLMQKASEGKDLNAESQGSLGNLQHPTAFV
jgi:uncharacterized protein involved in exopolysaccharide biosynthesis